MTPEALGKVLGYALMWFLAAVLMLGLVIGLALLVDGLAVVIGWILQ